MFNKRDREAALSARVKRGEEAKRLLSNELLKHTLASIEEEIIKTMKRLKPNDVDGRDTCWRELRAHERFKQKLETYATVGDESHKTLLQTIREHL
jgi:hypothetical protein